MTASVSFTLPMVPPSVNSLYLINFREPDPSRRVTLRDDCRRWKEQASAYVPRFKVAPDSILRIDWCCWYPWLTKTGKWAKRDTSNMQKLLFDMIAKKLGIDDHRFKCGLMDSVNSPIEKTLVVLTEIGISEWSNRV